MREKINRYTLSINWKHICIATGIIIADMAVYIIFGLLLMGYDDFYDESKGEYWSLASMTLTDKITYIGLNVWNAINLGGIAYAAYRLYRKLKRT